MKVSDVRVQWSNSGKANELPAAYFNVSPVLFVVLDHDGIVTVVNNFTCSLLELTESEIIGQHWFPTFVPAHARRSTEELFTNCMNNNSYRKYESPVISKSGRERMIHWNSVVDKGYFMSIGEDITGMNSEQETLTLNLEKINTLNIELEQRVVERTRELEKINISLQNEINERKQIESKLLKTQRLYHGMAANFPDGVIGILNQDMRYELVDGQELENLGFDKNHLIGEKIFDGRYPFINESAEAYLRKAFEGERTSFDAILSGKTYNVIAVPLPDKDQVVREILIVIKNISERIKLEDELYRTIKRERELNELKSRFVTMASHEFRTPLSTILSSVFLLENYKGADYDNIKTTHLNRIKKTINNLNSLLDDYLSVGKLEEGKFDIVQNATSIENEIRDIIKDMSSVKKSGQEIRYEPKGNSRIVFLDKHLLHNVLINLISNAIKYSPGDGIIHLSSEYIDDKIVIEIVDNGIGIPSHEQHHVFERFFRAGNVENIEGTGLGLHIVKKYVELMHGSINFISTDKGTTFTMMIPL